MQRSTLLILKQAQKLTPPVRHKYRGKNYIKIEPPKPADSVADQVIGPSKNTTQTLSWSYKGQRDNFIHPTGINKVFKVEDTSKYPVKLDNGGRQYYGFIYYPRYEDEEDPPYDPAPLHLVKLVKTGIGKPWWQKDVLKRLNIPYHKAGGVAIVKNTPEVNEMLYKIKSIIEISPIRIPKDLPDDVDPQDCLLKEDGTFLYSKSIGVSDAQLEYIPENLNPDSALHVRRSNENWDRPFKVQL